MNAFEQHYWHSYQDIIDIVDFLNALKCVSKYFDIGPIFVQHYKKQTDIRHGIHIL